MSALLKSFSIFPYFLLSAQQRFLADILQFYVLILQLIILTSLCVQYTRYIAYASVIHSDSWKTPDPRFPSHTFRFPFLHNTSPRVNTSHHRRIRKSKRYVSSPLLLPRLFRFRPFHKIFDILFRYLHIFLSIFFNIKKFITKKCYQNTYNPCK